MAVYTVRNTLSMHAQHIASLHAHFPDAGFVHMIRDGRASAASFHRRWGYVPQRTIYRWRNVVRTARQQAATSGAPYLEVFYERLTTDPEAEMRRVCAFLDLAYDDRVLSPSRQRQHTGSTDATITRRAARWAEYLGPRRLRRLEGIAGGTLAELGYEVPGGAQDRDPPAWLLRSWKLRDTARLGMRVLWKELTTPRDQKWDDLSGRILSAIRQRRTTRD